MRDILFKAKSIETDEWVYGYIQYNYDKTRARIINSLNVSSLDFPTQYIEVFLNSICQYIGKLDKDKNKIFEEDKVLKHVIQGNGFDKVIKAKIDTKFNDKEYWQDGNASGYTYYSYEVVGSIFDK